MSKLPKHWLGVIQVFLAALLWGSAGSFAKYLFNNNITPFDLAQMRITLSFLMLLVFFALYDGVNFLRRRQSPSPGNDSYYATNTGMDNAAGLSSAPGLSNSPGMDNASGLSNAPAGRGIKPPSILRIRVHDIPYFLLFGLIGMMFNQFTYLFTISQTNVATAVFLQYMAPALILIFGLLTRTEHPSYLKFVALAASILGGYLIVIGTANGFGLSRIGLVSGIAAAFAFAFYTIYGKYGLNNYSSWTILTWGFGVGAIAWLFYQFPWEILWRYPDAWLNFLFVAVFATILPFGLYLKGVGNLSAFKAGLIGTLEPVIGAISAFIFLDEVLNLTQVFGCGLVLLGVVLIQIARDPQPANAVTQATVSQR